MSNEVPPFPPPPAPPNSPRSNGDSAPVDGPDWEAIGRYMLVTLSSLLTFFGLGYALRRHNRGAFLFVWMLLSVPTIYYFTYTHPRYRHPIEPEMLVLMVYLFTQLDRSPSWRNNSSASTS